LFIYKHFSLFSYFPPHPSPTFSNNYLYTTFFSAMKLSLILVMAMAVLISAVPTGETDKANAVAEVANVEAGNANIVADVPNVHDDDPNGHDDDPDTEAFLASIGTDIANALADVPDVDVSTANPQDADPAGELAPDFCKNCEASYRLCLKVSLGEVIHQSRN
jgi:hypothetical protein